MHKNSISSQQSMTFSFHRAGRYTNDMTKANFVTSWARTSASGCANHPDFNLTLIVTFVDPVPHAGGYVRGR